MLDFKFKTWVILAIISFFILGPFAFLVWGIIIYIKFKMPDKPTNSSVKICPECNYKYHKDLEECPYCKLERENMINDSEKDYENSEEDDEEDYEDAKAYFNSEKKSREYDKSKEDNYSNEENYDDEEYECENCGYTISKYSTKCPKCGLEFEDENPSAEIEEKRNQPIMEDKTFKKYETRYNKYESTNIKEYECPNCCNSISKKDKFCSNCGKKIIWKEYMFPKELDNKGNYSCSHCKGTIRKEDNFCKNCGKTVNW